MNSFTNEFRRGKFEEPRIEENMKDFQSMSDLEMHINSSLCDESNTISLNSVNNPAILKPINLIKNEDSIDNSQSDEKKHKLIKEIDDCSLDISSVNSRTRFRKSLVDDEKKNNNANYPCHSKNNLPPNNHDNTTRSTFLNKNGNINNKENNFEDSPIKPNKNSSHNVNSLISSTCLYDSQNKVENINADRTDEDDRNAKKSNKLSFICSTCPEEFETAYQLKTHVFLHRYESQNFENASSPTTESESLNGNASSSETLSTRNSSIKRRNTKRKKPDVDDDNEEKVSKIPKRILTCDLCPKVFHRPENLTVHRNKYHNIKKNTEKISNTPKPKTVKASKCQQCSMEFESLNILQIHQTAYCFKAAPDLKEWVSKNMSYHFGCVVCGLSFKSSKRLEFHKEEHADFKWPTKKPSS